MFIFTVSGPITVFAATDDAIKAFMTDDDDAYKYLTDNPSVFKAELTNNSEELFTTKTI